MHGDTLIWVYLMKDLDTGYHKIGKSKDPNSRLYQLTKQDTKQPLANNFEIVEAWWVPERTESEMHSRFWQRRVRGEWFDLQEEDMTTLLMLFQPFQPYSKIGNPNAYDPRIDSIAKLATEVNQKLYQLDNMMGQVARRLVEIEKALGITAFQPFDPQNLPPHFKLSRAERIERLKDLPSLKPRPKHDGEDPKF